MKLLNTIFGKAEEEKLPDIPIRVGPQQIRMLLRGWRFKPRGRIYKTRSLRPTRFIDGQAVVMSFHQARLHDIYTSMREANEIRRVHRERQLEARAA